MRILCTLIFAAATLLAQPRLDPVKWSLKLDPETAAPGQKVLGRLTAKLDPGWHFYALTSPPPTIASTIAVRTNPALGKAKIWSPPPKKKMDPYFKVETEFYDAGTEFLIEIEIPADAAPGTFEINPAVRFQACDDQQCMLPVRRYPAAFLSVDAAARKAAVSIPAGYTASDPAAPAPPPQAPGTAAAKTAPAPAPASVPKQDTVQFVLVALGFGFAAIFTPCVFPMIPITMSYFLGSQSGSRAQSIAQAFTFSAGVIVLFTGLGAAVTAIVGPFGLNRLGANPWVNLFICVVFLTFGLSLLGAFEIALPSSLLTGITNASNRGGFMGAILMGLAFALASFACTGPFVGTLLAGSAQGGTYWPVLGMFAFATGMASPFFFLALFPAYLKRLPKSGGWLSRTKVTMGFFILAAVFKYLSNIDQVLQWNILTRERFLAAWIVILTMAGLYLLGILKLKGQQDDEAVSIPRLFAASAILILAVSLIPGMFGAKLGELDAYIPASTGPGLGSNSSGSASELTWLKDDFQGALAQARQTGKPIFVSFTGYACANCHWMKANMFTRPEIAAALKNFVLVELYADGTDPASESNRAMLESRFNIVAIPYYAVIRPDDTVVDTRAYVNRDPVEFEAFLTRAAASPQAQQPSRDHRERSL